MSESAAAVLVYDGEYAYYSVAVSALRHLDDVKATSWHDDAAQAFLDAQFVGVPFVMVPADRREDRVYIGRVTAKKFTGRVGMLDLLGNLVRNNYNRIAKVVGITNGRGRDPDSIHSTYNLKSDTAGLLVPLLDNAKPRPAELLQSERCTPADD